MARLQRKKAASGRKKKQSASSGVSTQTGGAAVAKKDGLFTGSRSEKKAAASHRGNTSAVRSASAKLEPSIFQKVNQFLREVKIEFKKVTWPSRKQTIGSTAVVIILVIIIAFFLGIVDISLSSLIRLVIQ